MAMADRIGVMDGGRLEQVGTPHEIYRRPATRFVADFIGEASFLEVTRAADGAALWPRTGVPVPCPVPEGSIGGRATLTVPAPARCA